MRKAFLTVPKSVLKIAKNPIHILSRSFLARRFSMVQQKKVVLYIGFVLRQYEFRLSSSREWTFRYVPLSTVTFKNCCHLSHIGRWCSWTPPSLFFIGKYGYNINFPVYALSATTSNCTGGAGTPSSYYYENSFRVRGTSQRVWKRMLKFEKNPIHVLSKTSLARPFKLCHNGKWCHI